MRDAAGAGFHYSGDYGSALPNIRKFIGILGELRIKTLTRRTVASLLVRSIPGENRLGRRVVFGLDFGLIME